MRLVMLVVMLAGCGGSGVCSGSRAFTAILSETYPTGSDCDGAPKTLAVVVSVSGTGTLHVNENGAIYEAKRIGPNCPGFASWSDDSAAPPIGHDLDIDFGAGTGTLDVVHFGSTAATICGALYSLQQVR